MEEKTVSRPTLAQLDNELQRRRHRKKYGRTLRGTVFTLITVAAIAVLVATMFLPVLQVYGSSMEPTMENGQMVVALKTGSFQCGDIVAFYYGNKILLKRVIGVEGDQIVIRDDGTVMVNGRILDEPYLSNKSLGICEIDFPYQVPDNRIFVLGDHRETSIDSRSTTIGCVSDEFVVGKVAFRLWPLDQFGAI